MVSTPTRCNAAIDRRQLRGPFAPALIGGSVDATVVNSPFEYRAEQKGFKVLLSIKETAEFVKIPINGLSTSQRHFVFAMRDQRRVGEKLLKLDRPAPSLTRSSIERVPKLPSPRKERRWITRRYIGKAASEASAARE